MLKQINSENSRPGVVPVEGHQDAVQVAAPAPWRPLSYETRERSSVQVSEIALHLTCHLLQSRLLSQCGPLSRYLPSGGFPIPLPSLFNSSLAHRLLMLR